MTAVSLCVSRSIPARTEALVIALPETAWAAVPPRPIWQEAAPRRFYTSLQSNMTQVVESGAPGVDALEALEFSVEDVVRYVVQIIEIVKLLGVGM